HALRLATLEFSAEDLADALWLAPRLPLQSRNLRQLMQGGYLPGPPALTPPTAPAPPVATPPSSPGGAGTIPGPTTPTVDGVAVILASPMTSSPERQHGVPVRLSGSTGLPEALAIGRSLRPFRRRQAITRSFHLDESRTAERLATSDIWLPVLLPGKESW